MVDKEKVDKWEGEQLNGQTQGKVVYIQKAAKLS